MGKKLVAGMPRAQSRVWPYHRDGQEFAEFVISTDGTGASVTHTCDPETLANYFGKNPGAPHFLTPVFFRREVLAKYFANSARYTIDDNYLSCAGRWSLRMDNNHEKFVVVFLGDLGLSLSQSEQLYWKSFNVPPDGAISDVSWRRGFLGEFADPSQADLRFKHLFREFGEDWERKQGWPLFRTLASGDAHLFTALRVPLTNDQAEFDGQVLALTKILIDSLNEGEIQKRIGTVEPNTKGLGKLERYLETSGMPDTKQHVGFLRNLQNLRSAGVGHRKGDNYEKTVALFKIGERTHLEVFTVILTSAVDLLRALSKHFLPETAETSALSPEPTASPAS